MSSAAKTSSSSSATAPKDKAHVDHESVQEFGGPIGAFAIMVFSHVLMLYLWISLEYYNGSLLYPTSVGDLVPFMKRMANHAIEGASPTWYAIKMYWGFLFLQAFLSAVMPGVWMKGLPVPSEGNKQHDYLCNGAWAWYVNLGIVSVLHYTGIFRLTAIMDNLGPLTTVSMLSSDLIAIVTYIIAHLKNKTHRMSGNHIYDYFMGAYLNPRIGYFDFKMWTELRVSWTTLFLLTLSAALKQYELHGVVSTPLMFMCLAHFLYANACMKGEECVITSWDIFYEKWGWMLIYWNLAGVPFVYCFNSVFILKNGPFEHSTPFTVGCFVLLLAGYYMWDTGNSQKNRFRMMSAGTYISRKTFPQLPWGTIHNPQTLKTECGSTLLVDGWFKYARKMHYTADVMMGLSWGLICGFTKFLPFFYIVFFTGMIIHRNNRDIDRCKRKYGKDWDKYTQMVPYSFIPFVY